LDTTVLKCVDATESSIADYGTLIFTADKAADADLKEFKFWNRLGEMSLSETASVCIVESYETGTLSSTVFERHQNTSETLIPTDDIIIVIALPGRDGNTEPDWTSVKAFRIKKGDAVILANDVWHYAPMSVSGTVKTFIVFNTNTPDKDYFSVDSGVSRGIEYRVEL